MDTPKPLAQGRLQSLFLSLGASLALTACGTIGSPTTPPTDAAATGSPAGAARTAVRPRPTAAPRTANLRPPPRLTEPTDAVPRIERIPPIPNRPYAIDGQPYVPMTADGPLVETGIASWYGKPFHGRRTSTGEVYDMNAMTAAHKTMPLPSYAVVRNRSNGRQIVVRVNDRGPFVDGRVIDLSHAAARKLGIRGLGPVEVRRITHDDIRTGAWKVPAGSSAVALAEER